MQVAAAGPPVDETAPCLVEVREPVAKLKSRKSGTICATGGEQLRTEHEAMIPEL